MQTAQVAAGASQLGLRLNQAMLDALAGYLRLLADWNRKFNLTAVPQAQWEARHLLDSLSAAQSIRGAHAADLGSGAGLPGLPLAIAMPDCHWTLIEKNNKRAGFLMHVKDRLGLGNLAVARCRAEDWSAAPFACVIMRAIRLTKHHLATPFFTPLLARGGRLVVMRGKARPATWDLSGQWEGPCVRRIQVPFLNAERHLEIWHRC